jgi:hypothetical protein
MEKLQAASTSIPVYPKVAFLVLFSMYYTHMTYQHPTTLGTLAEDTAIFATHEDPKIASLNLQEHLHIIEELLKKWKTKVKESKSSHIMFTLRQGHCPAVNNNNQTTIPQTEVVKYVPRTTRRLQVKLERTHHQKKKANRLKHERDQLVNRKRKSHLSRENKLLIYEAVIKLIWSYEIELWSCASKSNSHHAEIPIQNSQSHSKCTLVCNKSYAPHRFRHPLRK